MAKANQAVLDAEESVSYVRAKTPEIVSLAADLRMIRQRNHFAAAFESVFKGEVN